MFRQRVRASAPAGVAPEPPGDLGRIIWKVLLAGVCACILGEIELLTKVPCVAEAAFRDPRAVEVVSLGIGQVSARGSWPRCSPRSRGSLFRDRVSRSSRILASVQPAQPRQLVLGILSPRAPLGLVGVGLSFVRYPILGFSQPEGLSFVASLDRSGSSDALGELINGYDRVESESIIHDGVGIALL